MKQTPEFLLNLYTETEKETRPFSKIFAFIHLSEAVLKFYTVVTVQNFLEIETGNPALEEGKAVLGKGLARPSLGLWAFFTERITGLIPRDRFFWEGFPAYFEEHLKPATAILVNLRNKYHHGAVPSNEECKKDLELAMPHLRRLLFEGYIGDDRILVGDVLQGSPAKEVFLEREDGRKLELSPLLHAEFSPKSQKEELYYFNDAKKWDKGTINTISYDISEHRSNKEIFEEFRKTFPIPDWEKTKVSRFANRIAELTENFQGRTTELEKIRKFLTEYGQGYFFVWGGPGMGKSALIARSLILVRAGLEEKTQVGETGFDLGSKDIIVFEYFIRRATITEKEDTFYTMLGEDLESVFQTGISIGNNLQEKKEKWRVRLEKIQRKLNGTENVGEDSESEETKKSSKDKDKEKSFQGKKLILCIDGLDEGEEGILKAIPRGTDLYADIIFVLGGRDVTETRTLYTTLDADKKDQLVLDGLKEVDIRAVMLKVSKSESLTSEYISKLQEVSGGNPLYLKMITDSIERNEREAGDLTNLPKGVDELYDGIYNRIASKKDSEILLKILYFFTFTKDFLPVDVIAYFFQLEYFEAEFYVGEIREVLWENPMTEDVDDFQLFHESLRDYLRKKYDRERFGIQKSILSGLEGWRELCEEGIDPRSARYILRYAVTHLLEERDQKRAETFVLDSQFVKFQIEYLNFYTVSLDDAVKVLDAIVEELARKTGTSRPMEEVFKPRIEGEEFRTTTLVRLVNHAGELGHRAGTDIGIAWAWIEEGRVEEALERLSPIQDKQRLFDCYILALWMLTLQVDGEENRERLGIVLREIEKNIPSAENEEVVWWKHYSPWIFSTICKGLLEREQMFVRVYDRGMQVNFNLKKSIIYNWLGYEIVGGNELGDDYEQMHFDENKGFIKNYISKIILFVQNIEDHHDRSKALCLIAESIVKLEDLKLDHSLFHILIEVARGIEDSSSRSSALNSIGESLSKLGDVELGRSLFQEAVEVARGIDNSSSRSSSLNSIGESVSKLGDVELGRSLFQEAVEVARSIKDSSACSSSLSNIGESEIRLGNVELGRSLFQESIVVARSIKDSKTRRNALSSLRQSVIKLGDVELGHSLFPVLVEVARGTEDSFNRSNLLCSIGESVSKLGDVELGHSLFPVLIEVARSIKYSEYCSRSLSSIGESVSKLGDVELGRSLFPVLVEVARSIESSKDRSMSLISIAVSLKKLGFVDLGRDLYKESVDIVHDLSEISEVLYSKAKFFCRLGNEKVVINLFQSILQLTENLEDTLNRIDLILSTGESVCKTVDMEFGRRIFSMSIEIARGIDNTYGNQRKALRRIGESVSKLGDVELGRSLFPVLVELARGIEDSSDRSSSLSSIGESVSKLGDVDLGRSLFPVLVEVARGIDRSDHRSSSLSSIGESVSKLGDVELGRSLFPVLVEVARGIDRSDHRSAALSSIGESVSKLGDVELGRSLFPVLVEVARGIEDSHQRSKAMFSIGQSLCKTGDLDFARKLLKESVTIARRIGNSVDRGNVLRCIGVSLFNIGDLGFARSLLKEVLKIAKDFKEENYESDDFQKVIEFLIIIGDLHILKHFMHEVTNIARNIEDKYDIVKYKSRAIRLSEIARSFSIMGDFYLSNSLFQESIEQVHYIKNSYFTMEILKKIGESLSKVKNMELSKRYFPLLVKLAREIGVENSEFSSYSMVDLVDSISRHGESDVSNQLLPQILELGYQLKVSDERIRVLKSIAKTTAKFASTTAYSFFETNHESHPDIPEVIKAYTEEYRQINWEEPKSQAILPYYIRSFRWLPLEGELAKKGAYDMISTFAKLGKIEEALEAAVGIGMIDKN